MGDEVNVYAFARYRLETAEELIKLVEEYINKI